MKLKNFFTMTAIALCLASCSDENDPTPAQEAAKAIEGSYTGLMSMTVSGSAAGESEISVKITAEAEGTVKLSFPAMGDEGSMQLDAFEVSEVAVTASGDGTYTLSKETFSTTSGDISLEGSNLAGTVSNGEARITMDIKPGAMPMAITFTFDTQAEPTPEVSPTSEIAGNYTGIMNMSVMGSSQGNSEMTLTLTEAADGTFTISVPAMGSGAMAMGAFDITGVTASESESGDGTYTLSLASFEAVAGETSLTGSNLTGTVNGENLNLTMDIKPGAMPMAITFTFDTETTWASLVAGEYEGTMSMSVGDTSAGSSDMTLTLTEAADGTLTISVPAMGNEGGMSVGAFDITGVTASESESGDGTYTLSLENFEAVAGETNITGSSLTGTVNGESLNLTMDIKPGAMPMSITCTFVPKVTE